MQNSILSDILCMFSGKKLNFILLLSLYFSFSFLWCNDIPRGYKDVTLCLNLDNTKSALLKNPEFGYNGDRDVSLLPGENRVLIETDASQSLPNSFLDRCYFQFNNDSLYIITINLNKNNIDYYSIFTTLCKKYGEPQSINPQSAMWKNESTTMYLERPLTLKYIDNEIFNKTISNSIVAPANSELSKEKFLEGL